MAEESLKLFQGHTSQVQQAPQLLLQKGIFGQKVFLLKIILGQNNILGEEKNNGHIKPRQ